MKKGSGIRKKTRKKFKKPKKSRGKISITKQLQEFNQGDKVCLIAEPALQKNLYHPRFHGKSGIIKSKKGKCYEVLIKDKRKTKKLIVSPSHLKRL